VYHEGDPAPLEVAGAQVQVGARRWALGTIEVAPLRADGLGSAIPPLAERLQLSPLPQPVELMPGLALRAYRLDRQTVATGERLGVLLEWERTPGALRGEACPELELVRGEQVIVRVEPGTAWLAHPPSGWLPGERLVDWRDVEIPSEVEGGSAWVQVALPGGAPVPLGEVQVLAIARTLEPPAMAHALPADEGWRLDAVAALAGYDLGASEVRPGTDLAVTLYWKALAASERPLVAFVHLVSADGRLIAQHDGAPVTATRPTTGWLAGEYLADLHPLAWLDATYTGKAWLHVGLYDPETGQRLSTPGGDDHLVLPLTVTVAP